MPPPAQNKVDAAFIRSSSSLVSNNILDIGAPAGSARNPRLFEFVKKSGRGTGLTNGVVTTINATVDVVYDEGECLGTVSFIGQAIIEGDAGQNFAFCGDSGSPVVSTSNQPVGLLFAAVLGGPAPFAVMNPLPEVLTQLNVQLF